MHWDSRKLREYQEKNLRRIVNYAYNYVPFYNRKFKELNLKPSDIRYLSDLRKLPILRRHEVKKKVEDMISVVVNKKSLIKISTSGSTGSPLFLYISRAEDIFRKVRHLRANISCGQRPRDRWVTVTGSHLNDDAGRIQRFLRIYMLYRVPVFLDIAEQVAIINGLKPEILEGYSSSLLLLAKEVDRLGLETIRPRVMFSGAELIDESSRSYIEQVFKAPLYDHYATIELGRMAWQCPEKTGYHIDADAMIMQFVDENGEEVAPGEKGEVVCTSLFNYAMPLIRYAVGDVGVPSDEECSCGRSFPLMKILEGRRDSFLCLPDGRMVSPRSFTIAVRMFEFYDMIDLFRVVQKDRTRIEILIKLKSQKAMNMESFAVKFEEHIKNVLRTEPLGVNVVVKFVDNIPLDKSGKLMAVISELK
jgi:phenylacetate-CoA ligase